MRWMRLSIAGLMAVIAGFLIGLKLVRDQAPPTATAPIPPRAPYRDSPFLSQGTEALKQGMFAAARAAFQAEVKLNPSFSQGYSMLALVAAREGDYDKARRLSLQAIEVQEKSGIAGNTLPLLYTNLASYSLDHSLRDEAHGQAMAHCRVALDDLAKARSKMRDIDPYSTYEIEKALARVERRMGEVSAREGDGEAAKVHLANATKHADAARAVDRNDPRASFRIGPTPPKSARVPGPVEDLDVEPEPKL